MGFLQNSFTRIDIFFRNAKGEVTDVLLLNFHHRKKIEYINALSSKLVILGKKAESRSKTKNAAKLLNIEYKSWKWDFFQGTFLGVFKELCDVD